MQPENRKYKDENPAAPRQLDVELNTMILAASHTGRQNLVDKLKDLRTAVLGYARHEEEREAKESALLREVERVDRAAARIALETERLKRRRDEAMMIVRRLEPEVVREMEVERSVTQDDSLLQLNKAPARDIILNDNFRDDDDSEPKLTKMFGKTSRLRRHGSCGSLLPTSQASRGFIPPPRPLFQNWGDPSQFHNPYEGYPYPYPYMYGAMPPPHMGPPVYYVHEDHSQVKKRPHSRRREPRKEAEMSTDEGENTSNDAGDISSSEASGSGRRRKMKSNSPRPKLIPSHVNSADKIVQEKKSDKEKPLMTSTPAMTGDKEPEPTRVKDPPEPQSEPKVEPEPEIVPEVVTDKAKDFIDNPLLSSDNGEERKLYSPETDVTSKEEEVVEKKASVDRERKVGVPRVEESNAYQQMVQGGVRRPVNAPLNIEDSSTSDDIEAQLAVIPKPRNTFRAAANSVHNLEDESLSEVGPAPTGLGGRQGQVGHPLPLKVGVAGLAGGRLAHPAAQRVGMAALATTSGGDLSGPENDEDDEDFWS